MNEEEFVSTCADDCCGGVKKFEQVVVLGVVAGGGVGDFSNSSLNVDSGGGFSVCNLEDF